MVARNQKKVSGTTLQRTVRFIIKMLDQQGQTPTADFSEEEWGSETTQRKFFGEINRCWDIYRQTPLFEFVNHEKKPWTPGSDPRFIRLKDGAFRLAQTNNLSLIPASLEFLKVLKGTFLEKDYKTLFDQGRTGLTKTEQALIERSSRKFCSLIKGEKDFRPHSEQLYQIYRALLEERQLEISRIRSTGEEVTEHLCPLTLVMFQGGLYLLASNPRQPDAAARTYRIESFITAKMLAAKFTYPHSHYPSAYFKDTFGLFHEDESFQVELELLNESVVDYVKARRWTSNDQYEQRSGHELLKFTVDSLAEVSTWVLSFGSGVKVLKPLILKERVAKELALAASLY